MPMHVPTDGWGGVYTWSLSRVWLSATPWTVARQALQWDFSGKNIGVGCHFLLQGIFLTQGSNPDFLYCRQTLYRLSHQQYQYLYARLPGWKCHHISKFNFEVFFNFNFWNFVFHHGFPGGPSDEESACQCRSHKRCRFDPWVGKIPWGGNGNPL